VLLVFFKKNKILSLVTTTNIKTTGSLSEAGRASDVMSYEVDQVNEPRQ